MKINKEMAKKTQKLKVVKVPLGYYPENYQPKFPPMPVLYLELLENKDKVKKEMRNKDYTPPQERLAEQQAPLTEQVQDYVDNDFEIKDYSSEYPESRMGKKREPLKILDLSDPKPQVVEADEEQPSNTDNKEYYKQSSNNSNNSNNSDDKISERLKSRFEKIKDDYKKEQNTDEDSVNRYSRENRRDNRQEEIRDDRQEDRRDDRYEERRDDRQEDRRDDRYEERRDDRYEERRDERRGDRHEERSDDRREERYEDRRDDRQEHRRDDRQEERIDDRQEYRREERYEDRRDERIDDRQEHRREERYEDRKDDKKFSFDNLMDEKDDQTSKTPKGESDNSQRTTQNKIFDLLLEDDEPTKNEKFDRQPPYQQPNQYTQNSQNMQNMQKRQEYSMPPKLSEINTGIVRDNKGVRDITRGLTKQEEEEELEKRMLLEKFSILKKKYKEAKIPDFAPYTDLATLKRTYESTVRNLQLDATVDNYKRYLMIGFGGTQWLIQKFLKLDMTGFAEQQILSINQYESLLIEIGEKSYFKTNTASPEVRLMFLIGFNAVIFVMTKMMFNSAGSMMKPQPSSTNNSNNNDRKDKPHMKGPSFDDLKDFETPKKTKNE
jgi:hypothetical protein